MALLVTSTASGPLARPSSTSAVHTTRLQQLIRLGSSLKGRCLRLSQHTAPRRPLALSPRWPRPLCASTLSAASTAATTAPTYVSKSVPEEIAALLAGQTAEAEVTQLITCHLLVPRFTGTQQLMLVGNVRQLGEWRLGNGVLLEPSPQNPNMRSAIVKLPLGQKIEAKLMVVPSTGGPWWEDGGENRCWHLSLPDAWEEGAKDAYSNPGGFLVMMHWGLPASATEAIYFPPIQSSAAIVPNVDVFETAAAAAAVNLGSALVAAPASLGRPSGFSESLLMDPMPLCQFNVPHLPTPPGSQLVLCGDIPELGSWRPDKGLKLSCRPGHSWTAKLKLPANAVFEAKIAMYSDGRYSFEPGPYRTFNLANLMRGHFGSLTNQATAQAAIRKSLQEGNGAHTEDGDAGGGAESVASMDSGPCPTVPRTLLSTCLFTCYWGLDETPVVVGARVPEATEATDSRQPTLRQQVKHLHSEVKALHAELARMRALLDWARLQREEVLLDREGSRLELAALQRERSEDSERLQRAEAAVTELKAALVQARAQAIATAKEHSREMACVQQASADQRDLMTRQVQQLQQDLEMGELQLKMLRNLLEAKAKEEEQRRAEAEESERQMLEKERRRLQRAEEADQEMRALRAAVVEAERQLAEQEQEHEAEVRLLQEHRALLVQQSEERQREVEQRERRLQDALRASLGEGEALRKAARERDAAQQQEVARLAGQVERYRVELEAARAVLADQEEEARMAVARYEAQLGEAAERRMAELDEARLRHEEELRELKERMGREVREAVAAAQQEREEAVREAAARQERSVMQVAAEEPGLAAVAAAGGPVVKGCEQGTASTVKAVAGPEGVVKGRKSSAKPGKQGSSATAGLGVVQAKASRKRAL